MVPVPLWSSDPKLSQYSVLEQSAAAAEAAAAARPPVDLVQQEADKAVARAAIKKTGMQARDKMRELLAEALAMAMPDVVSTSACLWQTRQLVGEVLALAMHDVVTSFIQHAATTPHKLVWP